MRAAATPARASAAAPPPPPSRRSLLSTAAALAWSAPRFVAIPPPAHAAATAATPAFVPDLAPTPLPADFVDTSRRLAAALRTAVEVDRSDAGELEVRRKAEPAKNLVRDWMARYGGAGGPAVGGTRAHAALSSAIRTLGEFYRAKGARARLDGATAAALLAALDDAEAGLPAKKGST